MLMPSIFGDNFGVDFFDDFFTKVGGIFGGKTSENKLLDVADDGRGEIEDN